MAGGAEAHEKIMTYKGLRRDVIRVMLLRAAVPLLLW